MINIVLLEPEIPQNTGNIARTCACTGSPLHLIKPLGFDISDKSIKRAGLDYWDKLNLTVYESLDDFFIRNSLTESSLSKDFLNKSFLPQTSSTFFCCTTKAKKRYSDVSYPDGCFLLFGKETKGLPEPLIYANYDNAIRIPMGKDIRSLNLSNAVAIILYEALRQHNFDGNN